MANEPNYQQRSLQEEDRVGSTPQSPSSIDFSDGEESRIDELSSETYVNKLRDKSYPSTICIHTTAVVGEQVLNVIDEFDARDISLFSSTEIDSEDSDKSLANESIFTQHITIKFDDADEADACYIKLKESIIQTQYNIEISYKTLSHPGNLYVRWVTPETTDKELRDTFGKFGELTTCKVVYDENNVSKCYGFVNYTLKSSADRAIKELNNKEIDENFFYINHHISKKERLSKLELEKVHYTNLYVKNIPEDTSVDELTTLFSQYGVVESLFVPTVADDDENADTGDLGKKLKGFGFVNYSNHEDALNAQQSLNNFEILPGRHILVAKAQKRDKGDIIPSNVSIVNDLGSFTRDFNRLRMFSHPQGQPQGNYYPASPRSGQPPLPEQYYYAPPPPPTLTQLYGNTVKNGLPIAGPNYQDSNLYIKNLPLDIGDQELTELFEPFGEIVSAKVITSDGEHSKGYGFVCYKSPQHASRALLEMTNYVIDEFHVLHVSFAQRKDNRVGANGIIHHYNQNHFSYGSGHQNRPLISTQEQTNSQQLQPYSNIYPYYYYPQGPPPLSGYPPGATMIPFAAPPPLQQPSQKGNPRQFHHQKLQYLSPQISNQTQISQLPKSPMVLPGYGVDIYGRMIPSAIPRHVPQQAYQQRGYQMPPQQH